MPLKAQQQEPPEVILNNQKVIFNKNPILDKEGWLFPLEEIASRLQDKVTVDIVNGIITIQRTRDKSTVRLNVKNGIVEVNNRPFRTLFGHKRIILGPDAQMVPTSGLVILLGLTSKETDENKLILENTIGREVHGLGTIQPQKRTGFKDLLVDYLAVTNLFDWQKTQQLYERRTEINSGFHNDTSAITSDLVLKAGSGAPIINFDTANFSYFKNASPLQLHIGDKPLSSIKSQLLGGITIRGIQVQTSGLLKDSKFTFSTGLLPSNSKILGKGLPFVKYGRLAEVAEWSTSPKKEWQISAGQATYNDLIVNQLVRTQQTGGLFALSATKSGKYIEGDSNLAYGISNDKLFSKSDGGPALDLLIRLKPKDWFSLFSKGAYYSPGFYPLSANPFYNNRNETTFGFNLNPPRSNIGVSHSKGKFNLNAKKPNEYEVTNIFASTTPTMNGPTFLASYSENKSEISSTRPIDNLLFPINEANVTTIDLETLIERRTNSFFRASVLKSWRSINFTSSVNYFTFSTQNPLSTPLIGNNSVTKLLTYDLNIDKAFNRFLGIQTYLQGSELYKTIRLGIRLGPILRKKLNLQLLGGALLPRDEDLSAIYGLNLNYQVNPKSLLSINLNKTAFLTNISALWQYNLRPQRKGLLHEIGHEESSGRIKGRIIVLEETPRNESLKNTIVLPSQSRERGISNVRVHLGNYTIKTDEKGHFEFPSITPGVQRLRVEYSDIPSYLTSITPESVDINVQAGKETNFNFVLAYFGSIAGTLSLKGEPEIKLEHQPQLEDIRVYLDSSDFETLTNYDGSFSLSDVKPGKYKLKVDPDYLPWELEDYKEGIEIEVKAKGKIENIQLPIKYKKKQEEIKEFE